MRAWQRVERVGHSGDSGSTQPCPPASTWFLRCLEDCGHGVCSGPPDFTCVCDLGWTSDLPPPTPAPGPPAPRCSRDCGCSFHSHCRRRGPGYCDECQGKPHGQPCGDPLLFQDSSSFLSENPLSPAPVPSLYRDLTPPLAPPSFLAQGLFDSLKQLGRGLQSTESGGLGPFLSSRLTLFPACWDLHRLDVGGTL